MVSIDSYKLSCDIGSVLHLDTDRMTEENKRLPIRKDDLVITDPVRIKQHSIVNPCTGIKRITIDETRRRVILEGSAKVLQEQYREGITLNTFERMIDGYNRTDIIRLDPVEVLKSGELFTADISKNMTMDEPIPEYVSALHRLRCNNRYQVDQYKNDGRSVNGIVFKGKQRSFNERLIFYDKQKDVARDKDKEFRKYAGDYSSVLRSETNLNQVRRIKKYFGSNRLEDVFGSPVNANLMLFEKIVSRASNDLLRLFEETEGMRLHDIEKLKGRETIIRDYCGGDFDLVEEFIRHHLSAGSNPSRYFSEYRSIWQSMERVNARTINFTEKHIEEIRLKLAS